MQHHAGLDPEFPGLIAGREDNRSQLRTSDHDRFPFEVGVIRLFNGGKKAIHVGVHDNTVDHHLTSIPFNSQLWSSVL